ncbi:pollen-specific leucine-rich repeat extensin-like protein 3 [Iris pallida]|uniref:Pollen-specific leucine-rich repeat extensin-like protein 3 n=1 Tax=Iris pallida TaxID=29817 RepID=A0AAX6FSS8_IRIPA|nr:pollen-specific leucine-rich repeat extensin-like protein 3 [Iris pallida]
MYIFSRCRTRPTQHPMTTIPPR